jgi:crotonobetainyl-CoA:carnitine CoA-transferase CaiB-like acyl-CoA transferase
MHEPQALLRDVRVVEFSRLIAAPFCGLTLADLGADVVKVEPPGGDETRRFPPFLAPGESGFFHALNRGKRGVVLQLSDARGAETARRLIERADVVVENLGESTDRLGIDYARVSAANPKLVWCSITGLGAGEGRRAIDPSLQADMGLMALTGEAGRPPVRIPVPLVDFMTGMYATQQVITALWRAERHGKGELLDCALVDAAATLGSTVGLLALGGFVTPRRLGSESYLVVPSAVFEAADGEHVQVIALTERHWQALSTALGHPEWQEDPRCADNAARLAHRELVHSRIADAIATGSADHWAHSINEAGGMAQRVREIEDAWADPRIERRGLLGRLDAPGLDGFPLPVVSLARTADPFALARGPALGEHSEAVMEELEAGRAPSA